MDTDKKIAWQDQYDRYFSKYPNVDLRAIHSDKDLDISNFDRLVVLFHAPWSGSSIIHLSKILTDLNDLKVKNLPIIMVDIDVIGWDFIQKNLEQKSHGNGEAAFIQAGQITIKHTNQKDFHPFLEYLRTELN